VRFVSLLLAGILLTFAISFVVGFLVKAVDQGQLAGHGLLILGGALLLSSLLAVLSWQLSADLRRPGRSAFSKRYTRMWVIMLALSLPVGLLLGFLSDEHQPGDGSLLRSGPMEPWLAIVSATVLLLVFAVTMILYHRTIDGHEEHAYLWASTGGFYFLTAALPTAWLLDRGGLIGPSGLGTAMLLLLGSIAIQGLIWAWLKFR
jgi:hypothetical protein